MNPYLAYAAFLCLSSLLVGLVVGRRFLDRTQRTKCQSLAQDLTDKVHDRCDAYRRLEDRISCAITDFDRREADLRSELMGREPRGATATSTTAGTTGTAAAGADALAWMDACAGACAPLPPTMTETQIAENLNVIEGSAATVEGQVDAFSDRLASAQESSHALLMEQARAIGDLERRLRGLEHAATARPSAANAAFGSPPRAPTPTPAARVEPTPGRNAEMEMLAASIERSQRELLEWQSRYAASLERGSSIETPVDDRTETGECGRCLRARELAREILDLVPAIVPAPKPVRPVDISRTTSEASRTTSELEQRLSGVQGELDALRSARKSTVQEQSRFAAEIAKRDAQVLELRKRLEGLQSELSRAGHALHGNRSQITQLMQTLEETKARADARDRLLEEQKGHVSAAYAMLDRMRPLLHAIESTPPAPGRHA